MFDPAPENQGKKEFVLIQYPGIIKDIDKAMKTLGGLSTVSQNHFANKNLELRHTPDNPYTSCLTSEKKVDANVTSGTVRLVLKIRRKKKDKTIAHAECLGMINYLYTFESMCDFQYVPLRRSRDNPIIYNDLIPCLIPTSLESALSWWENEDDPEQITPLFLPPFQFSRYNTPSTKILCRETDFSLEKTKRKTGHGQNLRTERKALSVTVQSEEPFPDQPSQEAVDDANFRCKNPEPHRLLQELFEDRPMWTRVAISYKTSLEDTLIKSLLQKYAFYIQSGPWGRLWCRFGYDPRTDPESKMYQSLMVTFRQHTKIPERQRLKVSMDRAQGTRPENSAPINYVYQPGHLPRVRQMWYSLCDIQLPWAEGMLKNDYSAAQNVTTNGWINTDVLEELRELIKADVKRTSEDLDGVDDDLEITDDF